MVSETRTTKQPSRPQLSGASIHLALLLILLLAAAIRFYQLDGRAFWGDEALTADLARLGPASVLRTTGPLAFIRDLGAEAGGQFVLGWGFQMPMPLLVSLAALIGGTDMIIRLPSLVAGVLVVALGYALGKRLLDARTGLLLALLLAIASFQIQYSQEARYYGLMSFLSLLGAYTLWRALEEQRAGLGIAFVLISILNVWNHLFALFFVLPMFVYAVVALGERVARGVRFRMPHLRIALPSLRTARQGLPPQRRTLRSRLLRWPGVVWLTLRRVPILYIGTVLSVAALVILTSEVTLPVVRAATSTVDPGDRLVTAFANAGTTDVSAGSDLHNFAFDATSLMTLFSAIGSGDGWHVWIYAVLALGGAGTLVWRGKNRPLLFLTLWLLLPLVLVSTIRSQHFFAEKYIIFVQPAYLALAAAGLAAALAWLAARVARLRPGAAWPPVAVAGVAVIGLLVVNYAPLAAYVETQNRLDWRQVISYIKSDLHKDDAVVYSTSRLLDWVPFNYYFRHMVEPGSFGTFLQTFDPISAGQLQPIFETHRRVWIIDQAQRHGFNEIDALYPGAVPSVVLKVPIYVLNSAPTMVTQVPFTPAPGADTFFTAHGVVDGQELIIGLKLDRPEISNRFDVYVTGEKRGQIDPSGDQAPNYVRMPIGGTQIASVAVATANGTPADVYSGTLTMISGVALPEESNLKVEAERFATDNAYINTIADASNGAVTRALGFGTVARYSLWLSKPGDYLLTLHGRLEATLGSPLWSVVLDRQAVGTFAAKPGSGWQDLSIPVRFTESGLHVLVIGVTAQAYIEGGVADLDYIQLQERPNWVWRSTTQVDLGTNTAAPADATGLASDCVTPDGLPGLWLTGTPVSYTVSVDTPGTYTINVLAHTTTVSATLALNLDENPAGSVTLSDAPQQPVSLLASLSSGQHLIMVNPPSTRVDQQVCLQSLALQRVAVQPDNDTLRIDADPLILGENAKLETLGSQTAAVSAGTGTVIQAALWFSNTGNYEIGVYGLNDRPAPVLLQVQLDDKPVGDPLSYDRNDYSWIVRTTVLSVERPGYHILRIIFTNDYYDQQLVGNKDDGDRNGALSYVTISNLQPPVIPLSDRVTVDLADPSMVLPPGTEVQTLNGVAAAVRAGTGHVADIDLTLDSAGGYRLTVTGQNDRPGPVELAVLVDDRNLGTLTFGADDESWSDQSLLFTVPIPGYYRVSLVYLNDLFDAKIQDAGGDGDRNAAVARVEFSRLPAAISTNDAAVDLNFDDLLRDVQPNQPQLQRIDGGYALVFRPGNELTIPVALLNDGIFVLELAGRSARLTVPFDVEIAGQAAQEINFRNDPTSTYIGLERPAGAVEVVLRNRGNQDVYVQTARLYANILYTDANLAWTPNKGYIDPAAAVITDTGHVAAVRVGAGPIIALPVLFPKAGVYRVGVTGQNDRPGPVILDVRVGDVQKGQIYFSADDYSWETRSLQIVVDRQGLQIVTIAFNNDAYDQALVDAHKDGDRNALIERVQVVPFGQ